MRRHGLPVRKLGAGTESRAGQVRAPQVHVVQVRAEQVRVVQVRVVQPRAGFQIVSCIVMVPTKESLYRINNRTVSF